MKKEKKKKWKKYLKHLFLSKTTVNPLRKKNPIIVKKTPTMVTDLTANKKICFFRKKSFFNSKSFEKKIP